MEVMKSFEESVTNILKKCKYVYLALNFTCGLKTVPV